MENILSLLPLLFCPVAMGLMMWLLMRGNTSQAGSMPTAAKSAPAGHPAADMGQDDRLAKLRAQLGEIQVQQAAIVAQIGRLQAANGRAALQSAAATEPVEPAAARRDEDGAARVGAPALGRMAEEQSGREA